ASTCSSPASKIMRNRQQNAASRLRSGRGAVWRSLSRMCLVLSAAALPAVLNAQAAATAATAPPAPPVMLPLSGRTGVPGGGLSVQNPAPGGGQSVNPIPSPGDVQGPYEGSVPAVGRPGAPLALSLAEAVRRGLEYNLGTVGYQNAVHQAFAQRRQALS